MSDNVSSGVIFHFTRSIENLKGILRNGFLPRYCLEYTLDPRDKKAARENQPPMRAAPMVCLCDLPVSVIAKHIKRYGNFGIGLDKKWGIKNGLSPVTYTHAKACTRKPASRLTSKALAGNGGILDTDLEYMEAFTKPYVGYEWRKRKVKGILRYTAKSGVKFYDEREWRYVPYVSKREAVFVDLKEYKNQSVRAAREKRFHEQNALVVPPDAIQYLILPDEEDENNIIELHEYLKKLYGRRDGILVTSAIMTEKRIYKDI